MISKLVTNIIASNYEHRGICQSSRIRIELYQVEGFLNAGGIHFDDDQHILKMLQSSMGDDWVVSLSDDGVVELLEIPDNWVKINLNNDGTVNKAYYV